MWNEIRDQVLHVLVGAASVFALAQLLPLGWSFLIAVSAAIVREMLQHPWSCGKGCAIDLTFWTIGSAIMVGLMI